MAKVEKKDTIYSLSYCLYFPLQSSWYFLVYLEMYSFLIALLSRYISQAIQCTNLKCITMVFSVLTYSWQGTIFVNGEE